MIKRKERKKMKKIITDSKKADLHGEIREILYKFYPELGTSSAAYVKSFEAARVVTNLAVKRITEYTDSLSSTAPAVLEALERLLSILDENTDKIEPVDGIEEIYALVKAAKGEMK